MTTEYETLFDIFNDITITIINNNLSMKDKIIKKIDIIKNLSYSNIDVLNYNNNKKENLFNILNSLNYKLMSVKKNQNKLNNKLNTILGMIIHNAYISAGYQVLLSNIPITGENKIDNKKQTIDGESIYDTIEHYIGEDKVINVIQIDSDKYLVKFKNNDDNNNDANTLCHLIHNMMIKPNIIRAEMLKNDTMENIDVDIYKCFKNEIDYNTIKKTTDDKNNDSINDSNDSNDSNDEINGKINDNDICDYGLGNLDKNSVFSKCINLVYEKYKYVKENIKSNIHYLVSFFYKIN
jgi:hypothetical protein